MDPGSDAEPPEDVHAALRAISRLAPATSVVVYLGGADLRDANLRFMSGAQVNIDGADLASGKVPDDWNVLVQLSDRDAEPGSNGGTPAAPGRFLHSEPADSRACGRGTPARRAGILIRRPGPGNFIRRAVCGNASLVFVTELLARRFSRLPALGGPPGGAAPR